MSSNLMERSAATMNDKFKAQASQGVIIQGYCQGIINQPLVDFGNVKDGIQIMINHANHYLSAIQPQIITNISNIQDYYYTHNSLTQLLSQSATDYEWLQMLTILQHKVRKYEEGSKRATSDLTAFSGKISNDATAFNAKVQGGLQGGLKDIDGKIATAMKAAVLSGFVNGSAILVTVVGSLIDSVMGSATIATGVSGASATVTGLVALLKEKDTILQQQPKLTEQVIALEAINASYQNLSSQVGLAINAAQQMSNGWNLLGGNIHQLGNDLRDGRIDTDNLREWFMFSYPSQVGNVKESLDIVKTQLTGVSTKVAPNGENLSDFLAKQA